MLFTVALALTIIAAAVPALLGGIEEHRARNAARYLASRVRLARATAVARSRMVGLRFERDGIRTADVRDGTDRQVVAPEWLSLRFKDTRFGFLDGVPAVEDLSADGSSDPIHAGVSDIVSLSPQGSATSATLYICGPRRSQYAVRVLGTTGRTRVLEFNRASRTWLER
jgi:Tfp pilus assembly protein FimT